MLESVDLQPDHTGEAALHCRVREDHSPAAKDVVFAIGRSFMQSRIGVQPMAKDPQAREAKGQLGEHLKQSVAELSFAYCLPDVDADCYSAQEERLVGYLLKYSLYNAYVLAAILEQHQVLQLLAAVMGQEERGEPLEVVSVGGGPLTDWLGLLLHWHSQDILARPALRCTVYDLPMWAPLWPQATATGLGSDVPVAFRPQDLCALPGDALPIPSAPRPVLVLFLYVVCELVPHAAVFTDVFVNLARDLPPGSVVLIVERMRQSSHAFLLSLVAATSQWLTVLVDQQRLWVQLPTSTVLEVTRFVCKFGLKARTKGPACVTLLQKKRPLCPSQPTPPTL
eukprot:GGOE01036844.1.p1 GENE.GGOE01036844.1~~GGOE01036844.1.p1  ORF type:complete len:339 (-),score=114.27 GGOE01036844.1:123-1139(-)